jgi:hypothetical protein
VSKSFQIRLESNSLKPRDLPTFPNVFTKSSVTYNERRQACGAGSRPLKTNQNAGSPVIRPKPKSIYDTTESFVMHSVFKPFRRAFFRRQNWTIVLVASSSQSGSANRVINSMALKNFTALGLGLPSARSLPALIRMATSSVEQFNSFATCSAKRRGRVFFRRDGPLGLKHRPGPLQARDDRFQQPQPCVARRRVGKQRRCLALRQSRQQQPELHRQLHWVPLCEGALISVLLPFNPFEHLSVRFYSGYGQAVRAGSQARATAECFLSEMAWLKATTY